MYALRDAIQDLSDHLHRCFCWRIFADHKELEDRRGITKSTACRMRLTGLGREWWPDQRWSAAVMSLRC